MVFFFFFKDPAPTEIYPLSLPAALPTPDPRRDLLRDGRRVAARGVDDRHIRELPHPGELALRVVARALLHRLDVPGQDRKSTRLNSSHANISYAVFCLKKKKKEQSDTTI